MRRVEELTRVAQALPMDTQLAVDVATLEARLADLPDEINAVLRIFDGGRALRAASIYRRPTTWTPWGSCSSWSPTGSCARYRGQRPCSIGYPRRRRIRSRAAGGASHRPLPPLRGMRRERLRREAEQARAKHASAEPVRLHHVVELPPRGQAEMLGELRRVSPAVGQAAKTFTADAQLARVLGPDQVRTTEPPPIAPVAATTPPPGVGAATGERPRRRWAWFFIATVALTLAWVLRPQPRTERKDAPWLETMGPGST